MLRVLAVHRHLLPCPTTGRRHHQLLHSQPRAAHRTQPKRRQPSHQRVDPDRLEARVGCLVACSCLPHAERRTHEVPRRVPLLAVVATAVTPISGTGEARHCHLRCLVQALGGARAAKAPVIATMPAPLLLVALVVVVRSSCSMVRAVLAPLSRVRGGVVLAAVTMTAGLPSMPVVAPLMMQLAVHSALGLGRLHLVVGVHTPASSITVVALVPAVADATTETEATSSSSVVMIVVMIAVAVMPGAITADVRVAVTAMRAVVVMATSVTAGSRGRRGIGPRCRSPSVTLAPATPATAVGLDLMTSTHPRAASRHHRWLACPSR